VCGVGKLKEYEKSELSGGTVGGGRLVVAFGGWLHVEFCDGLLTNSMFSLSVFFFFKKYF